MNLQQEAAMARVKLLLSELNRSTFQDSLCPLLMRQIEEAQVFTSRLGLALQEAARLLEKDAGGGK